jgi:hypothetical protein
MYSNAFVSSLHLALEPRSPPSPWLCKLICLPLRTYSELSDPSRSHPARNLPFLYSFLSCSTLLVLLRNLVFGSDGAKSEGARGILLNFVGQSESPLLIDCWMIAQESSRAKGKGQRLTRPFAQRIERPSLSCSCRLSCCSRCRRYACWWLMRRGSIRQEKKRKDGRRKKGIGLEEMDKKTVFPREHGPYPYPAHPPTTFLLH